jgi:hypothetical protein
MDDSAEAMGDDDGRLPGALAR